MIFTKPLESTGGLGDTSLPTQSRRGLGFAFLSNRVQSAAFRLAPLPPKDTQDGGLSSEFFYSLHFGEGPAVSELSFTLLVNRNEDTEGQDVQPLSLGQSSGSSCSCLRLPSSWTGQTPSLSLSKYHHPLPAPRPPYLSYNKLITSKCACFPQREESGEGPTLERRALSP